MLAFLYDLRIPLDNNHAERGLRMLEVQQKVSGSFRSVAGAAVFGRLRGFLSTLRKQCMALLAALNTLLSGELPFPAFARTAQYDTTEDTLSQPNYHGVPRSCGRRLHCPGRNRH